jgi:hypothetical protein
MRSLTQSAFVDEYEDTPFSARFFFSSGQTFFFQLRICSSLRSPLGAIVVHPTSHCLPHNTEPPSNLGLTQSALQHLYGFKASFL